MTTSPYFKTSTILIAAICLIGACVCFYLDSITERAEERSCYIQSFDSTGVYGTLSGSGVIYGNGWIVTAKHVTLNHDSVLVHYEDGTYEEAFEIYEDPNHDISLIKVSRTMTPIRTQSRDKLKEGTDIFCYSCPGHWKHVFLKGYIVSLQDDNYIWLDSITADINILAGSSGCGVYTKNSNKLIGIGVGYLSHNVRSLAIVVPVDHINSFIEKMERKEND